jgi:Holliday junction resolvase
MRRAARKDANHNLIADHLRKLGWSVLDLSRLGGGCPDMVVGRSGYCALVECKQPGEKLTPDQVEVKAKWDAPYFIAYEPEQIAADLYIAWRGIE